MSKPDTSNAEKFEEAWSKLLPFFTIIFKEKLKGNMSSANYMECVNVITTCSSYRHLSPSATRQQRDQSGGAELYARISAFAKSHCVSCFEECKTLSGEALLDKFKRTWEFYEFSSAVTDRIASYINRYWVKTQQEHQPGGKAVPDIITMCHNAWRDEVFIPLNVPIVDAILVLIQRERMGDSINTSLINGAVSCMACLLDPQDKTAKCYKRFFEEKLLTTTEAFYARECSEFLSANSVTEYIKKVEARLGEEQSRLKSYLHHSSTEALMEVCNKVMISTNATPLHDQFVPLLEADRDEDLRRLYALLNRVDKGLDPLRVALEKHVVAFGSAAVEKEVEAVVTGGKPEVYVETLLTVYRKFSGLVKNSFSGDAGLTTSMERGCKTFFNTNAVTKTYKGSVGKTSELLAKHCDALMKKGEDVEPALCDVMIVFKYLDDRDIFQKFYSHGLAKRLVNINAKTQSEEAEESMLSKLKAECGYEYTSKLTRMFNDVNTSKDLNVKFRDHAKTLGSLKVDFNVQVLTSGMWPFKPSHDLQLPTELQVCVDRFSNYYKSTVRAGAKLQWLLNLCKGDLVTSCFAKPYTFQASTVQIALLMQFNAAPSATVQQLLDATRLPDDIMTGNLDLLVKMKILTKDDKGVVAVNPGYKYKTSKVKIDMPIATEQKKEDDNTMKGVDEDRSHEVQAALVRLMKMRKEMTHTDLITECITQLSARFQPKVTLIKSSIDLLIEKEYMRRVEGTKDRYSYIA